MKNTKPTCFLFDGNSFMHRAYNVAPGFMTKEGFPTGAISGFLNMSTSVINNFSPDMVIFVFDAKGKNFRHDMYSEYKANRAPTASDLAEQFQPIKDIIAAWGHPCISISGVEADDVLGTIADRAVVAGYSVVISTSDKDMNQLVSDDIKILNTQDTEGKSKPFGIDGVVEKMGVRPEQVRDLLAIMGDDSDNVPGVPGVGPITAAKWINQYGSLVEIINCADELEGAYGKYFRDNIEQAKLSYKLVTIDRNVELPHSFSDISGEYNEDHLISLVNKYELRKFQNKIGLVNSKAEEATVLNLCAPDESTLNVLTGGRVFVEVIKPSGEIAENVSFMVSPESEDVIYNISAVKHLELCMHLLTDLNTTIVSLDAKSVLKSLSFVTGTSVPVSKPIVDLKILFHMLSGVAKSFISVKDINQYFVDIRLCALRETYKLDDAKNKWLKMSIDEMNLVKAEEVSLAKTIIADESALDIPEEMVFPISIEYKLLTVISGVEKNGIKIDVKLLENLREELTKKLEGISANIFEIAGEEFNIASPPQVKKILFETLEISSKKKTTDEKVLNSLKDDYPITGMILEWRSLSKLISQYTTGLIDHADSEGVIRTNYNQTVVNTGRLSSTDPNLQNIPIKTEDGRKIREAFVAREGYKILCADYAQIELRILAHASNEPTLINAFNNDVDVHKVTASEVFGVPFDEVDFEQRRSAKGINFGLIYGIGSKALALDLGVSSKVSKEYIASFFIKYPSIQPYMESQLTFAKQNMYVNTITGRRLQTRDVNSNNPMVRGGAERSAKNAPLQGTAADIIKIAMVNAAKFIEEQSADAKILLQVHDELIFEIKEEVFDELSVQLLEIMETAVNLKVKLSVDGGSGYNWLEAH